MTVKEQIDRDLKSAMLSADKPLVDTLRGLKSAILYEEVAKGSREEGLAEAEVLGVLAREAKKRQESAELYRQGGDSSRADKELSEKAVIEKYMPPQMSEADLDAVVEEVVRQLEATDAKQMGQVISEVKERVEGGADGSRIAQAVKKRLIP